ncbi:MAG: hypothetical protein IIZ13_07870 [Renibacterium sp.]|nr:hypothetical protein [Renibacterium sp.]
MSQTLVFSDDAGVADFRTFVSRARAADDGAIRLQASSGVLAAWVCSMRPKLLGEGTPTVLGLRTMAVARQADSDDTVSLASVADRLARLEPGERELPVPPMGVREAWASVSPPRADWRLVAQLDADRLIQAAKTGVREVAQIIPVNPGALIVNNARASVWGRELPDVPGVPAGAAFAGYALGFWKPGEPVALFQSARWLRLSSGAGHVLVRPGSQLS